MNGELVQEGTWLPVSKVVLPANGTLVLGQDQDEAMGGFDATQSFCGEFTDLQVGAFKIPIHSLSTVGLGSVSAQDLIKAI